MGATLEAYHTNDHSRHPRFTLEAGCTREASKVTSTAPETLDLHHKGSDMPQHSKKTDKESGRADLQTARQPESTYIAPIQRPLLGDKANFVRGGFARGLSFKELIQGSGLKSRHVLVLCGLNPDEHIELLASLEEYRTNQLNYKE